MRHLSRCVISLASAFAVLPMQAPAHHSPNVHFDRSDIQEISGTLTEIKWQNPHVQLTILTLDESGKEVVWRVEETSPIFQQRRGVSEDEYRVGMQIKVAGFRGRRNRTALFATNTLLADGRELISGQSTGPRWTSDLVLTQEAYRAANVPDTTIPLSGIFRVWGRDRGAISADGSGRALWNASYPLTENARAVQASWDRLADNPFIYCLNGMPAIMDSAHPMEFVQLDEDILIRLEEQDVVRRIHMGTDGARAVSSPYGYSVGRLEGDTLVVTTTEIDFPWFDQAGIPQSDALELIERFSLSDDERYLNYSVTATDLAVFTEPVVLNRRWVWLPGEDIKLYECSYDRDDL